MASLSPETGLAPPLINSGFPNVNCITSHTHLMLREWQIAGSQRKKPCPALTLGTALVRFSPGGCRDPSTVPRVLVLARQLLVKGVAYYERDKKICSLLRCPRRWVFHRGAAV